MNLFISLKSLVNRINRIDERTKNMYFRNTNSSNPFSFSQNKTYVWVEKPTLEPQCRIENDDFDC